MASNPSFPHVVLPARMSLRPKAFQDLEIAVLKLPYQDAINQFVDSLKNFLGSRMHWRHYPPYRVLNNTITACTPTVVHGFEKYYCWQSHRNQHRMLAVGKAGGSPLLQCPDTEDIADIIRDWVHHWGQSKAIEQYVGGELALDWTVLEQAVEEASATQWTKVSPASFLENIYAENGLAFDAVPALLSTLLHGKTSVVGRESSEHTDVRWRRSQDEHGSLCVVSQPIPITFTKKAGRFGNETVDKAGFFTYKLVFRVQLQTGRTAPWIYAFLHCQRYVDKPLKYNKRGHNITVLTGISQDRLSDLEPDTTLVRLKASSYPNKDAQWLEYLPRVLEAANARSLVQPYDIYQAPRRFWQSDTELTQRTEDEYYIPYVEGYQYDDRTTNSVATGFGLAERSEVIEQTCCKLLKDVLEPDSPLTPDEVVFPRRPFPLAIQTYKYLAKKPTSLSEAAARKKGLAADEESRRQYNQKAVESKRVEKQPILTEAIAKAIQGKQLHILLVYRNKDTKVALHKQIRETLLLNEQDKLPEKIVITECPIISAELQKWLDVGDLDPKKRHNSLRFQSAQFIAAWDEKIFESHCIKRDKWIAFLQESRSGVDDKDMCCTALVELPTLPSNNRGVHADQGIKGAIREACAHEEMLSQMIQPVSLKTVEEKAGEIQKTELKAESEDKNQAFRLSKDEGRTLNAVQDLMVRQLGILYGAPTELYKKIGLEDETANALDVISFCITETRKDVLYCCAVRLRANGSVDVKFPEKDVSGCWIPYSKAGWKLGKIFGKARQTKHDSNTNDNPIRLSKSDLNSFVETTLTHCLESPTIAIIRAKTWRQGKTGWRQLRIGSLTERLEVLEFEKADGQKCVYKRNDKQLHNLLGIIRVRTGDETPQYITNRESWQDDARSKDLAALSGFIDITADGVFHYFSVGRVPNTVGKPQSIQSAKDPYKVKDGGGVSFKHQQMVEMVPFFVRPDFQPEEGKKLLCRVPHYLRSTPAWSMGNIVLAYPMHLGDSLLKDYLCILDK